MQWPRPLVGETVLASEPGPKGRDVIAPTVRSGLRCLRNQGGPKDRNDYAGPSGLNCSCGNAHPDLTVGAIEVRRFAPFDWRLDSTDATGLTWSRATAVWQAVCLIYWLPGLRTLTPLGGKFVQALLFFSLDSFTFPSPPDGSTHRSRPLPM